MAGTVRLLSNLGTYEVSLVKKAANKKRYAFTKSEEENMNPVKAVLSTPAEGEDQLVETLKSAGADEQTIEANLAAYRVHKGFADLLNKDALGLTVKAAEEPKPVVKSAGPDLSKLDSESRQMVEQVFKSQEELVAKSSKLEQLVTKLLDSHQERDYVAKAEKEFSHIPGTPTEIAHILKSAYSADPKAGEAMERMLKGVNEIVSKSAFLGVVGSAGSAAPAGSAEHRLNQMAEGLTLKSDEGKDMTREQKIAHVLKSREGAALYREYLAEHPAQRADYGF